METTKGNKTRRSNVDASQTKSDEQDGDQARAQFAGTASKEENSNQSDLLQQAKQTAGEVINQVQQRADSQLNRQKDSTASDISNVVNAVRRFRETLAGEEVGPIGKYAAEYGAKAADKLEQFSAYIRNQDAKQVLNDVQDFGRRRPAILLGGAFLLGFAGARLIRSSLGTQSPQNLGMGTTPSNRGITPATH